MSTLNKAVAKGRPAVVAPIDNLIPLFNDGLPVGTSGDLVSSAFVIPRPEAAGRRLQAGDGFSEATEAWT